MERLCNVHSTREGITDPRYRLTNFDASPQVKIEHAAIAACSLLVYEHLCIIQAITAPTMTNHLCKLVSVHATKC